MLIVWSKKLQKLLRVRTRIFTTKKMNLMSPCFKPSTDSDTTYNGIWKPSLKLLLPFQVALNVVSEFGVGTSKFGWPVCSWVSVHNNVRIALCLGTLQTPADW